MGKKKFWVFNLKSQITWGKHNGKDMQWITDNDPQYIVWIAKNMSSYSMRLHTPFINYYKETTGLDILEIRKSTGYPFRVQ